MNFWPPVLEEKSMSKFIARKSMVISSTGVQTGSKPPAKSMVMTWRKKERQGGVVVGFVVTRKGIKKMEGCPLVTGA